MCRKLVSFICLVVIWHFAMVGTAFAGQIIRVDIDREGGDGTSWLKAYKNLQDALHQPPTSGDQIWVAEGIYKPDEGGGQTPGDRTATFQLINGVAIYGGFAGKEFFLEQRNWGAHETILSGDIGTPGDRSDNSIHVVKGGGTNSTVLDGFTITAGYANGSYPNGHGAGMYDYGSPKVTNCTFRNNSANYWGGGMYIDSGNPTLTNCTFIGNSAGLGGGMSFWNGAGATLTSCMFIGNSGSKGGALDNEQNTLVFTNCIFSGNTAGSEGGGMYNNDSSIILTNCTFSGNLASTGGGMYNYYTSPTVTNCILWGNSDSGGMDESAQIHWLYYGPVVRFSCIQGLNTYAGNNNIGDDPRFRDADGPDDVVGTEDDNLRLNCALPSPCMDAGNNGDVPGGVITDLDGKSRFFNCLYVPDSGSGTPPIVDMGAYEAQCGLDYSDDIKWSQPPVELNEGDINGWDEVSIYYDTNGPIIADDWVCKDDRPIKDIHWWGSFKGWAGNEPPDDEPNAFHIGIWTDVPDTNSMFSHPGRLIWEKVCSCYVWSYAGNDLDPRGIDQNETCFKFDQLLSQNEWFYQDSNDGKGRIYWLSIAAIYDPCEPEPNHLWGWKTRPHFYYDDAVRITDINDGSWPPTIGAVWASGEPIEYPAGTSWDTAFVLTTNRHYEPRTCGPIEGDLNGDCIVDFEDFALMAPNWLVEYLWP